MVVCVIGRSELQFLNVLEMKDNNSYSTGKQTINKRCLMREESMIVAQSVKVT